MSCQCKHLVPWCAEGGRWSSAVWGSPGRGGAAGAEGRWVGSGHPRGPSRRRRYPGGCTAGTPLVLPGDDGESRSPYCCQHRGTPRGPCDKALRAHGSGMPRRPPCQLPPPKRLCPMRLSRSPSAPRRTPGRSRSAHSPPVPPPGALPGGRCQGPLPKEVFLPLGALRRRAGEPAALAPVPARCPAAPRCKTDEQRGTLSAIKNKRNKTVLLQAGVPPAASRSVLFNNVH